MYTIKTFETIRHSAIAETVLVFEMPDCVYDWILNYLDGKSHVTNFSRKTSTVNSINASVVHGSVIGPAG